MSNEIQPSGGPRSTLGKLQSSKNSLTHGCWGKRDLLLKGEKKSEYISFIQSVVESYVPINFLEGQLAAGIGHLLWKTGRVARAEAAACADSRNTYKRQRICSCNVQLTEVDFDMAALVPTEAYLEKFQRIDAHLSKQLDKAMDRLERIQAQRRGHLTLTMEVQTGITQIRETNSTNSRRQIDPTVAD